MVREREGGERECVRQQQRAGEGGCGLVVRGEGGFPAQRSIFYPTNSDTILPYSLFL